MFASCRCGQTSFETVGAPILRAICYCASCQAAGRQFADLPGAPGVCDVDGGTDYVLYRKDRVRCLRGAEHLQDRRLTPASPTRRVLAACCNSPMFLDFSKGHWLSLYRGRIPDYAGPVQMRVMTRERPNGADLPGDVPNYPGHSGKFMWKLLTAWAGMGFRIPGIIQGTAAT